MISFDITLKCDTTGCVAQEQRKATVVRPSEYAIPQPGSWRAGFGEGWRIEAEKPTLCPPCAARERELDRLRAEEEGAS